MLKLINDFRKIPVVRLLFPFIAGIVIAFFSGGTPSGRVGTVFASLLLLPLLLFCFKRFRAPPVIFFLVVTLASGWSGYMLTMLKKPSDHLHLQEQKAVMLGRVESPVSEREFYRRLEVRVTCILLDDTLVHLDQQMVVHLPLQDEVSLRSTEQPCFSPGDLCYFAGTIRPIRNRGNTGEFDYRFFMARKNFFYTFIPDTVCLVKHQVALKPFFSALRWRIIQTWGEESERTATLAALGLGDKSYLDKETRAAFSTAGAMHLLAVSGLHVGIIWWIIDRLLYVPRYRKRMRSLKLVVVVGILWCFAALAGFSQSVTRAVVMFSIVTVARLVARRSNIYQTLFTSALILLFVNPWRLQDVGFQLSYLAVLGIVSIHPLLSKYYAHFHPLPKRITDLLSVSLAAQLATLPLSLFYFHQFPVLFFITNLVAIPMVSVTLSVFAALLPFCLLFPYITWLTRAPVFLAGLLNKVVQAIASIPFSSAEGIMIPLFTSCMLICLVVVTVLMVTYRQEKFFLLLLLLASAQLLHKPVSAWFQKEATELEIGNFRNASLLTFTNGESRFTLLLENPPTASGTEPPGALPRSEALTAEHDRVSSPIIRSTESPGALPCSEVLTAEQHHQSSPLAHGFGSPVGSQHPHAPLATIDPYLAEHLAQLSAIPSTLKQHRVTTSAEVTLAHELWALQVEGTRILIAGDCSIPDLQLALEQADWHLLLLRTGAPCRESLAESLRGGTIVVGDGTLRKYESARLSRLLPSIYMIPDSGAFKMLLPEQ